VLFATQKNNHLPMSNLKPLPPTPVGRGIVNIINFIRGQEPRCEVDLVAPVVNQMRLARQHNLPVTWLFQYDALIDRQFRDALGEIPATHEIGGWFEFVRPMVEKAGMEWRGRYDWDWHSHIGFSIGYTPAERERLVDVYMAEFKHVFGRYPRSVGSWMMDAHSLGYMADRYRVSGSCICKEQWGTDGYTLWGGYYGQAFYPSRKNAFMPAQDAAAQISVPVFRMLGSDPIYQYDVGLIGNNACEGQAVVTLEPVYPGGGQGAANSGGGSPAWVRWFFDVTFRTPCLTFGYAQVGQENSFGWPAMATGLTDQMGLLAEWVARGELRVETLETSARHYAKCYPVTPASAITALTDFRGEGRKSVWYCSRFYRTNLFWDAAGFRVRDLYLFDEDYAERYLTATCPDHNARYDTLPVIDGLHWCQQDRPAGFRIIETLVNGERRLLGHTEPVVEEQGDRLAVRWMDVHGARVEIICAPDQLTFHIQPAPDAIGWELELVLGPDGMAGVEAVEPAVLRRRHNHFPYRVACTHGRWEQATAEIILVVPVAAQVVLAFGKSER
jgi:hypothetical protein